MTDMTSEHIEAVVKLAVSEVKAELTGIMHDALSEYREEERKYHDDKRNTAIKLLTGATIDSSEDVREFVTWGMTIKRRSGLMFSLIMASFIGLWAKSFWEDISNWFH